jgi:hypothetical protein
LKKQKNLSKLIILDINLKNLGGHGYSYNTEVAKSASKKFTKTIIYHHPQFQVPRTSLNFSKLSCLFFYTQSENLNQKINNYENNNTNKTFKFKFFQGLKFYYKLFNSIFYTSITLLKEFRFKWKINLFYQHPLVEDLYGIFVTSTILRYIPFVKVRFSLVLRNTINEIIGQYDSQLSIFKYLKNCKNIDFFTDSKQLTEYYQDIYSKQKITTLPIPISNAKLKNKHLKKNKDYFSIGVLGPPRADKGFFLLPKLVKSLIENNDELLINLYIQIDKQMFGEIRKTYKEVEFISKKNTNKLVNIKFLKGPLSEKNYKLNFAKMDIILILYNHPRYKFSTSGIFAESLILNIPTISWDQSWMAHIINEARGYNLKIGECVSDIEGTVTGINSIKNNFKRYKNDLKKFTINWDKSNNYKEIANYLFNNMQ